MSRWSRYAGMSDSVKITREKLITLLNEDLAREYQAIIAYTVYSQTIKGAAFTDIARELAVHAGEELAHALQIAKQIDYLNGQPVVVPKEVKVSKNAEEMLRFDLENEKQTIINYRQRIRQAEELGEYAIGEVLRKIIAQEQEHLTDLADALGIDNPDIGD
jgi:bacterioferritin